MEETPASQKMEKIDLINSLEKISSEIPNRILKLGIPFERKSKRTIRNNYFQRFQ